MIKYKVLKNGIQVAGWSSDDGMDETYWQESFGLPERPELDADGNPTGVTLPAEYTISIVDLNQDPTWLLQQCHEKRIMEYPPLGEFADAYVKLQQGDSSQMETYVLKCIEVKNKYPKP